MLPNNWKLLIIAPVSALFLTACPDNGNRLVNQSESVSRFSGWWINENLDLLYRNSKGKRAAFCQGLATDFNLYGVTQDKQTLEVAVDAWVIRPNGEVLVFVPGQERNPNARNAYIRGFITPDGSFVKGNAPMGMPGYNFNANMMQPMSNPYYFAYMQSADVSLENERLEVSGNQGSRVYVRMDMNFAAQIHRQAVRCYRQAQTTQQMGGVGQQYGQYGQYGVMPPPVPRAEEFVEERTYNRNGRRATMGPPMPVPPPVPGPGPVGGPVGGPAGGVGAMPDVAPGEGMPVQ